MTNPLSRAAEPRPKLAGQSVKRRDLYEKVTGAAIYTVDVTPPGALHGKAVRSTRAHATIIGVDKKAALELPGVIAVITADDLTGIYPRFGHIIPDHVILATGKVRYYGEPIALVVAESTETAADALDLVDVIYDDLPAAMNPEQALADDAPLVQELKYPATGDDSFSAMAAAPTSGDEIDAATDNIAHSHQLQWGNVEAAAADAAVIVENVLDYPMLYAYAMEALQRRRDLRRWPARCGEHCATPIHGAHRPGPDLLAALGQGHGDLAVSRRRLRIQVLYQGGTAGRDRLLRHGQAGESGPGRRGSDLHNPSGFVHSEGAQRVRQPRPHPVPRVRHRPRFGRLRGQQPPRAGQDGQPLLRPVSRAQPSGERHFGLHQHLSGVVVPRLRGSPGCHRG